MSIGLGRADFAVVSGANGAGKTTLLRILATTLRPSTGRITWDEKPKNAEDLRRRIGYCGHQPLLYDELTARENLAFVARTYGVHEPERAAESALAAFDVAKRGDERASNLSRGLRQRLALARAFVVDPRLLILDEPTASLDVAASDLLFERLKHVAERTAVVLATHEPARFDALATRHWELVGGHVNEGANA